LDDTDMPAPQDVANVKSALRSEAEARRAQAAADDDGSAAVRMADNVMSWRRPVAGDFIGVYWPFRSEIDTRPLIHQQHAAGCVIGLPVVTAKAAPLVFRQWTPDIVLVADRFGVLIPGPEAAELTPRTVVTPLLAFDRRGYRLGYGGGFYDRTLAKLRAEDGVLAVGVGFAAQEMDVVPTAEFDMQLDAVATETAVLELGV
jgi:5-formyltetrahydrofolate cyclo-ligase